MRQVAKFDPDTSRALWRASHEGNNDQEFYYSVEGAFNEATERQGWMGLAEDTRKERGKFVVRAVTDRD